MQTTCHQERLAPLSKSSRNCLNHKALASMRQRVKLGRICRLCGNDPSRHIQAPFTHCPTPNPLLTNTLAIAPIGCTTLCPVNVCASTTAPPTAPPLPATTGQQIRDKPDHLRPPAPQEAGPRPAGRSGQSPAPPAQFIPGQPPAKNLGPAMLVCIVGPFSAVVICHRTSPGRWLVYPTLPGYPAGLAGRKVGMKLLMKP